MKLIFGTLKNIFVASAFPPFYHYIIENIHQKCHFNWTTNKETTAISFSNTTLSTTNVALVGRAQLQFGLFCPKGAKKGGTIPVSAREMLIALVFVNQIF